MPETTVEEVLRDAFETDFGDQSSWEAFQQKHHAMLNRGTR